jgi:hypothetical protein
MARAATASVAKVETILARRRPEEWWYVKNLCTGVVVLVATTTRFLR